MSSGCTPIRSIVFPWCVIIQMRCLLNSGCVINLIYIVLTEDNTSTTVCRQLSVSPGVFRVVTTYLSGSVGSSLNKCYGTSPSTLLIIRFFRQLSKTIIKSILLIWQNIIVITRFHQSAAGFMFIYHNLQLKNHSVGI